MPTRLGVIGSPIAHSLSPIMHRAALDALGRRDVTYDAIEIAPHALEGELERLARDGYVGLNVTVPHKTSVLAHLARIDDVAREIGAVNTLLRDGERWIGTNTDAVGFARSLDDAGVRPRRVVVLGAGGAARAVVVALRDAHEIVIAARNVEAARDLACLHPNARAESIDDPVAYDGADLLVQATSAMLGAHASRFTDAIPIERLAPHATVVDLVYRPRETLLLARARASGLVTVDGVGMLVHQGAASLERWLGVHASIATMRAAVIGALG
jgi:shikimate dehydrogenase